MPPATWKDLDDERRALPRKLSRADMARRAGLSESTIAKGIKENRRPHKDTRDRVRLILALEAELGRPDGAQ